MFTDIRAAIEEARWLRQQTKHHHVVTQNHVVTQKRNGFLSVRQEVGMSREALLRKSFSTRYDCHNHTVLPEAR